MGASVCIDAMVKKPDYFEKAVLIDWGPAKYINFEEFPIVEYLLKYTNRVGNLKVEGKSY